MKYRFIMNPSARSGRGQKHWEFWQYGLQQANVEHECFITHGTGDAFQLARDAEGECIVTAVGGDGTINEVLDGILQSGNPGLRMGVLYAGTSPDFCRFHRIPFGYRESLACLLKGHATLVDVGRVRYKDEYGKDRISHFGCSTNTGMGAAIARYANRMRPYLGDAIGTFGAVIRTLVKHRPVDLELFVDGEPVFLRKVNHLCVVKNPFLASGLKLDLPVQPDDGKLWLLGLYGKSKSGVLTVLPCYYTGLITHRPGIYLKSCCKVRIIAPNLQELEFDGDPRGYLPMEIEILPKALALVK